MIRRVLIPLDGSELAEQVVPHLLRFAAPDRTELLLMTAISSSIFSLLHDNIKSFTSEQMAMLKKNNGACGQVYAVMQQLNETGFSVTSQFLSGVPAECILRVAEKTYVDLIAMSTHGRTGLGLALLGSVADEVVRNARPPLFLTPAKAVVKPDLKTRIIILPLDGTPLAETAISVACQFAQNANAVIHMVRVVELSKDTKDESTTKQASTNPNYVREQPIIQQATCYLERIQLRLQLAGIVSQYQVAEGEPADSIIRTAHAENADLIVMSTHGRAGVERMVYGSVVKKVIRHAIWPLLLMRGKVPVKSSESEAILPATSSSC